MSFLTPVWLWAAAAIALPTLIHLLARGRGRVVALGTIRFLPQAQSHRLRHLRPTGLLRYLLRAALLLALALALATPRWWRADAGTTPARWALVDPVLMTERERLEKTSPTLYEALDAITQSERRWLAPGIPPTSGSIEAGSPTDLWSVLSEAAAMLPANTTFEVFASDRIDSLRGARPTLPQRILWWSLADPEPNEWIQRLVPASGGLVATLGHSDPTGTLFTTAAANATAEGLATLGFEQAEFDGIPVLVLAEGGVIGSDDRATLPPALEPLLISIVAGAGREEEARAVQNAATAVAAHLGRHLVSDAGMSGAEAPDLRIILGPAEPAPSPLARVSLADSEGGEPCRQMLFSSAIPDSRLQLGRCAGSSTANGSWHDGWGDALLTRTERPDGIDYQWHGRFDSNWSSLVENGLPHLLLELVAPGDESANGAFASMSDRRVAGAGQAQPQQQVDPARRVSDPLPERIAWGLVALLFVLDRLLVRRSE